MKRTRFSEEQIKEQESGIPTAEVCRKLGISPDNYFTADKK